jgi:hypothetical protein
VIAPLGRLATCPIGRASEGAAQKYSPSSFTIIRLGKAGTAKKTDLNRDLKHGTEVSITEF